MPAPFRIGLAGLGNVGEETARILLREADTLSAQAGRDVVFTAYSVRNVDKARGVDLTGIAYESDPVALAARTDVDVVVELMGGADGVAYDTAVAALRGGKHLVTANKAMLAAHWRTLFDLSEKHHGAIMFEASVGGGMPVVKVLREGLAGNRINSISGILNGTCNYILSAMQTQGVTFEDALSDAQAKGYAEADPTLDVDGADSAHKLLILARLAFSPDVGLDDITVQGIRGVRADDIAAAKATGGVIRLVATAGRDTGGRIHMQVKPEVLAAAHPFAHVGGAMNAVYVAAQPVESCTLIGPGAGGGPTASAVLADIIDLARFDIVLEGPLYLRN